MPLLGLSRKAGIYGRRVDCNPRCESKSTFARQASYSANHIVVIYTVLPKLCVLVVMASFRVKGALMGPYSVHDC